MSLAKADDASYKFAFGVDHPYRGQRWVDAVEKVVGIIGES